MPSQGEGSAVGGRRIYTRRGDDGSTGLLFGGRVPKDHPRIEACGALDEAIAAIGLARSFEPGAEGLGKLLFEVQRQLFVVGAEAATGEENRAKLRPGVSRVTPAMVERLEQEIDRMVEVCPLPDYFVIPGETKVSALLDAARVLVRRAERRVVALGVQDESRAAEYLNRLSDLLFVAARLEESVKGAPAHPSRASLKK